MKSKPKYKTYGELAAAFKSGELSLNYFLVLDKSGTENHLCYRNAYESDRVVETKQEACSELFDGDHPIEELFDALGIPAEWC